MSTQYPDLFAALAAPFRPDEVKSRSQAGRQLQYITARTAMNRLDDVLGPENWWDEYTPGENSVVCRLTIRIPDPGAAEGGGWMLLRKQDAGGYAGMPDHGDDDKSGFSDSFKRACVKFGVGRYLYRDGVPGFVSDREPTTPGPPSPGRPPSGHPSPSNPRPSGNGNTPRSGRALFAWTKDLDGKDEPGLLRYLNNFGKELGFPGRMVDWDESQVAHAHDEALRKIREVRGVPEGEGLNKQYSEAG